MSLQSLTSASQSNAESKAPSFIKRHEEAAFPGPRTQIQSSNDTFSSSPGDSEQNNDAVE